MHEGDRRRAFADREHAGKARLERVRRARERPTGSGEIIWREVGPRLDETFVVAREASAEPLGVRRRAGHDEGVPNVSLLDGVVGVTPRDAFEMSIAM